ncbi:MAG TPA: hypothetical protein PKL17_20855, partial [Pseudomonadota bacterium]|nr:hypothetical protein [Pseudomonadota bacterium]
VDAGEDSRFIADLCSASAVYSSGTLGYRIFIDEDSQYEIRKRRIRFTSSELELRKIEENEWVEWFPLC